MADRRPPAAGRRPRRRTGALELVDPPVRLRVGEDQVLRATLRNLSARPLRVTSSPRFVGLLLDGAGGVVGGGGVSRAVGRDYRLRAAGAVDLAGSVAVRRSSRDGRGGPLPLGPLVLVVRLRCGVWQGREQTVPVEVTCPAVHVEVVLRHPR